MKEIDINRNFNVSPRYLEDHRVKFTEPKYYKPIHYNHNSRYQRLRTLHDSKGNIYHENWIKRKIDFTKDDAFFKITMTEKDRLDIISLTYYGTSHYWWVIALANNIIDPFDVPIGTELRIPLIESLYNKGGILSGN